MAKIIPPYIDKNCKSRGEKIIFDILNTSPFTKDWIVLHSLNLSNHSKRLYGEIDFLLMIPNGGIFVMEVKGGDVKCIDGEWYYTDRYGNTNKNKSPFSQAHDAMFSLKGNIEKEFGKNNKFTKIQFGYFVAFPQLIFNKSSVEYESWQILDKDTIDLGLESFFVRLVKTYSEKHKNEYWYSPKESLPSKNDLIELCAFLRGDFERIISISDRVDDFKKDLKVYTEEQFRNLDSIQLNSASLIQGSAGTGKTMIAIESAKRSAAEGKFVFLTCYNRLIAEWMKSQLIEWADNITVTHLHSFLLDVSKGFDYDQSQQNKSDFYTSYLPLLHKDIFSKGIHPKFDKIIIDEGQDLIREEYLQLFDSMLKGGLSAGNWEIYGDFERQAIYSQLTKENMIALIKQYVNPSMFLLKINCRNTIQIGEETSMISGFEKPPFLLEHLNGIPVEYSFYENEQIQKENLLKQINRIIDGKLTPNNIVILSPKKFENSIANQLPEIKNLKHSSEILNSKSNAFFATIQSFKGMESDYIIIADIDDITSDIAKSILYVGMSRAKFGLIININDLNKKAYKELLKQKLK